MAILNKKQIAEIEKLHKKAHKAQEYAMELQDKLGKLINSHTGVLGSVNFLMGDGLGFCPLRSENDDNYTHILVSDLIILAEKGANLTFEKLDEVTPY